MKEIFWEGIFPDRFLSHVIFIAWLLDLTCTFKIYLFNLLRLCFAHNRPVFTYRCISCVGTIEQILRWWTNFLILTRYLWSSDKMRMRSFSFTSYLTSSIKLWRCHDYVWLCMILRFAFAFSDRVHQNGKCKWKMQNRHRWSHNYDDVPIFNAYFVGGH